MPPQTRAFSTSSLICDSRPQLRVTPKSGGYVALTAMLSPPSQCRSTASAAPENMAWADGYSGCGGVPSSGSQALSRSSAMLAEACHSTADTANQIFLLVGMRKSARPPDRDHPFGYGPETYFWAFMVALCIFSVGGGFSVHEGVEKILHRNEPGHDLGVH